ncbi:hypothetical protein AXG93_1467s1140 [Marchantia polymorpha subsp. ruderalis]|uniref:Uncharacterized protein n=1 Tax=Marchantia polymorpha subsp. ruderalis TaxID=1480154 RepID=A0A176WMJ7_MARPO|nr:hypothetical protein AXG93_1467s1140 [Marchantia polymorpha subsp. ruderalis]
MTSSLHVREDFLAATEAVSEKFSIPLTTTVCSEQAKLDSCHIVLPVPVVPTLVTKHQKKWNDYPNKDVWWQETSTREPPTVRRTYVFAHEKHGIKVCLECVYGPADQAGSNHEAANTNSTTATADPPPAGEPFVFRTIDPLLFRHQIPVLTREQLVQMSDRHCDFDGWILRIMPPNRRAELDQGLGRTVATEGPHVKAEAKECPKHSRMGSAGLWDRRGEDGERVRNDKHWLVRQSLPGKVDASVEGRRLVRQSWVGSAHSGLPSC